MAKTKIECNDCGDFNNYVYHQGGGEYLCCECLTKKLREADKIIQELKDNLAAALKEKP